MVSLRSKLLLVIVLLSFYVQLLPSCAIKFRVAVPRSERRCYFQDVLQNTLMVVSASSSATEGDFLGLEVSDGVQKAYQNKGRSQLKTAFTAIRSADYEICVINHANYQAVISVSIEQGTEAKDYSQIAKKEHLEPTVALLREVEDRLIEYHKNVLHLRSKHFKMKNLTDSTSSRVILFCILTVTVLLMATVFQFLYLRSFLRSKKII